MNVLPSALPAQMARDVGSNGASPTADTILALLKDAERHLEEPMWSGRSELESLLFQTFVESSAPNWDGYGAKPVEVPALQEAHKLMEALPPNVVKASVVPEPSGALALEWRTPQNDIMVASVKGSHSISYAISLRDGTRDCGLVRFTGVLPKQLGETLVEHFGVAVLATP